MHRFQDSAKFNNRYKGIIVWASMALSMPRLSILALVAHAAAAFNTAGVLPLRMPIRTIAASNGR